MMATFFRNKGGKSFENYSSSWSHSTTAEHQRRKCTSFYFMNSLIIHALFVEFSTSKALSQRGGDIRGG